MVAPRDLSFNWRNYVVSPWTWRRAFNQAGADGAITEGEGGGFFVQPDGAWRRNRRGYLKPVHKSPDPQRARAAREKIASDLAADLGFCVPPVVLVDRFDAPAYEERWACVSLVLFRNQWSWGSVRRYVEYPEWKPDMTVFIEPAARRCAASALAFDTWLGQIDHGDHPHNILIGYDEDPTFASFVFLDYAMALGFDGVWSGDGWQHCSEAPFPPLFLPLLDRHQLDEFVSKIEQFSEDAIIEVVDRIPASYLTGEAKATLKAGLSGRRFLVRKALSEYLDA